jgi:hypothetical protein
MERVGCGGLETASRNRLIALAGAWIELETEYKSLLQVLNEDADFRGHPAACWTNSLDGYCPFKRSEETSYRASKTSLAIVATSSAE